MAYNSRQSMAHGATGMITSNQKRQEELDPFILSDADICDNVTILGIPFGLDDLRKPQPQTVQRLYESLAEICMGVTRETVGPSMSAAAIDVGGPDMADRLFSSDVRDLMGLFVRLKHFAMTCQINDFGFADLFRPTYPRLQKILSYIINFVRFRETNMSAAQDHVEEKEKLNTRYRALVADVDGMQARLDQLIQNRKETEKLNKLKEAELERARRKLLDLDRQKNKTMDDGQRATDELKRLGNLFDEKQILLETTRNDAAKLRPYTFQKPDALETHLRDLNSIVNNEKAQIETVQRRARALQTSADSFKTAQADVAACSRVLTELANDLTKEEDQRSKAARFREALSEKTNNAQDVEREEKVLQKRLDTISTRTEKLHRTAGEKNAQAAVRMNELKEMHAKLQQERQDKAREIDKRKLRIEQTEKKMMDLKENTENEINAAREQYLKMESHINLYISEMGQCISG